MEMHRFLDTWKMGENLLHLVCRAGAKQKGCISTESGWQRSSCASITHLKAGQETTRRVAKSTNDTGDEEPQVPLFFSFFRGTTSRRGKINSRYFFFGTKPGGNLSVTNKAKTTHTCTHRNGLGLRTNVPLEEVGKTGEKGDGIEKPSASGGLGIFRLCYITYVRN